MQQSASHGVPFLGHTQLYKPQALTRLAPSKSREKILPARPIQARAAPSRAFKPHQANHGASLLHKPIGALLERWVGLRQPLPAKLWDTTPWKVEEERATWRRGSTAGTQTTLTVSPEWRRDTLASPTPWAAGAGRSLFRPVLPCSKAPAQLHFFDPTTTVVICSCRLAWKSPYA